MPSPFPGMNPYLEHPAIWPDFHLTLIVALRAEINARLPKGFLASTDRHVRIERKSGRKRLREPDLSIVREPRKRPGAAQAATLERQQTVTLPIREAKGQPYLKVLDAQDRRVATVLKLLGPSNKSGEDHLEYLAKREEYFASPCGRRTSWAGGDSQEVTGRTSFPASFYAMMRSNHAVSGGSRCHLPFSAWIRTWNLPLSGATFSRPSSPP